MLRFKRLTPEELTVLEQNFIQFLSAQSITAHDWIQIKESDVDRADELIDDFSNVVFGSVMSDAKFLEKRTKESIFCYQCLSDRFVLIGCTISSDLELDKDKTDNLVGVLSEHNAQVFTSEKNYAKEKEDEIYAMMQQGCEITDGKMFKLLSTML